MATVTELCADLASGNQVKAYQARRTLLKHCTDAGAAGRESDRTAAAAELAKVLAAVKPAKDGRGEPTVESMITVGGATDVCRALALVGGDAEVPALAECLKNIDLREAARWCLTRMTCQAATDALASALGTATGTEFRVGLVNALAKKSGSSAAEALKTAAGDAEPEVRLAAAEALAETPDPANDAVIAAIDAGKSSRRSARVARARIRLAYTLLTAGDKQSAKSIFTAVGGSAAPEAQKKAAAAGLLLC